MRLFIRSILVMKSTKPTAAIVTPPADTMLPEKENKGSRSQSKNADKEHYKANSPRRHPPGLCAFNPQSTPLEFFEILFNSQSFRFVLRIILDRLIDKFFQKLFVVGDGLANICKELFKIVCRVCHNMSPSPYKQDTWLMKLFITSAYPDSVRRPWQPCSRYRPRLRPGGR